MKYLLNLSVVTISLLTLTACVSSSDLEIEQIKIIPAEFAARCIEKGNVYSEAPYYGVFTDTTTEKLENLAKESAFRLGASYVVLDKPVEKGRTITMQGKAYTCP